MAKREALRRAYEKVKSSRSRRNQDGSSNRFECALADRVDYLNGAHWDRLTASQGLFLSRRYLRVLEEHGPENSKQRYGMLYRGRTPVVAVAMQVVDLKAGDLVKPSSAEQASQQKGKRARILESAKKAGRKALDRVKFRALLCGDLFSWGCPGVAFAQDESSVNLWPQVHEVLERVRRAENLDKKSDLILVKDVPKDQMADAAELEPFQFNPIPTEPDMVLNIPEEWRTYDDYLASLTSKYRKSAKAMAKQLAKAGGRVEPLEDLKKEGGTLYRLYLQVQAKADLRINTLAEAFLPALAKALGEDLRCKVVRWGPDDEIVGFVTMIKDDLDAIGYFIGFDHAANGRMPVYFQLLHAVVGDAIESGCRRLSFGRTALDPKARLGARAVPYGVWVRHRQSLLNVSIPSLLRGIPHGEPPERNPFK